LRRFSGRAIGVGDSVRLLSHVPRSGVLRRAAGFDGETCARHGTARHGSQKNKML
jgi:hypothetical protein